MNGKKRKALYIIICILLLIISLYLFPGMILIPLGEFLVVDEKPPRSDVVVVLNTGVEYYPRLIEAASIYNQGYVKKVVINGDRKTDTLRELEKKGFKPCCPWYEDRVRILEMLGVPRKDIITISAEDVYDTICEAKVVGEEIIKTGISSIIITTSKSHTRRARYIWKKLFGSEIKIFTVAAKSDSYLESGWWREGRQIKWVLSEYGAWVYGILKLMCKD